jgi:membrane protein implicated in regulation of membrane protease activity
MLKPDELEPFCAIFLTLAVVSIVTLLSGGPIYLVSVAFVFYSLILCIVYLRSIRRRSGAQKGKSEEPSDRSRSESNSD